MYPSCRMASVIVGRLVTNVGREAILKTHMSSKAIRSSSNDRPMFCQAIDELAMFVGLIRISGCSTLTCATITKSSLFTLQKIQPFCGLRAIGVCLDLESSSLVLALDPPEWWSSLKSLASDAPKEKSVLNAFPVDVGASRTVSIGLGQKNCDALNSQSPL